MAYVNTARTLAGAQLVEKLTGWVGELRLAMTRRAVYRQTLTELSALSDRELHDLGLHRSSLPEIASEAAYGA